VLSDVGVGLHVHPHEQGEVLSVRVRGGRSWRA
jgi:hypothetical protein